MGISHSLFRFLPIVQSGSTQTTLEHVLHHDAKKKIYLMIAYSVLCWVLSWFTTCMDLKCKMHLLWVWVLIEKTWNPGSFAFKATCCPFVTLCQCLKILKKSHFVNKCLLWILAFSTNFCPIKPDLSGISVWPQALGFQKLAKLDRFWHF